MSQFEFKIHIKKSEYNKSMEFRTATENGDAAFSTSGSHCLDFFTRIVRSAPISDYIDTFRKAWNENTENAIRILMNLRDVRDGKGEKLIPVVILVYLRYSIDSKLYEEILRKFIEYGYWKDLLKILEITSRFELETKSVKKITATTLTNQVEIKLFAEQLKKDYDLINTQPQTQTKAQPNKIAITLCAKWAPSEKTHFDHHPIFAAAKIRAVMGLTPKEYRLMLTKLRSHLVLLETLMSQHRYTEIDFSKLPSVALMKMKKAFQRDSNSDGVETSERKLLHQSYSDYLANLAKGQTKVNIRGIQPHELVDSYLTRHVEFDQLIESQWNAIKNRVFESGAFRNVTAIVDVSGSMNGQPMTVAIALGILVAECTKGIYHGKVITFHERPSWHILTGSTLKQKVGCLKNAPWGGSTNLRSVFDMILQNALDAELASEEMVKTLFIFTDMQFDSANHSDQSWESTFESANRRFNENGYKLPQIICWNLRTSCAKSVPITQNELGYAMLSGFSAELLKCILSAQEFTPYSMMLHVLEPYQLPETIINTKTILNITPTYLTNLESVVEKSATKKSFKNSNNQTEIETKTNEIESSSQSESF